MATSPVRTIQHHDAEHPFVVDLPAVLTRLAALPPSTEAPYLTVSLDWRPEGSDPSRRPGRMYFDQRAEALLAELSPHTPPHENVAADLERIRGHLDGDIDPATKGLVVVACSAQNVFELIPLPVPVTNHVETAATPALLELARISEDEPAFAVLLADQREATLLVLDQANQERSLEIEGDDYPRKQQQGGWSQRRFQQRADERREAFVRTVVKEVQQALAGADVEMLILAGDDQINAMMRDALHPTIQELIIGTVAVDIRATDHELIEASLPVVTQAEREHETATVGRVENGAGPGGGATVGAVDTLTALQAGQVMILVMNDDFSGSGWADYTYPMFGAGDPPAEHPGGGDAANIVPVSLAEELVRLALRTGAEIEVVRTTASAAPIDPRDTDAAGRESIPRTEAATRLDALGGAGAILRYALSEEQSTAEL
jgi:peptide subunit release factor 1 (eRF1)